MNLLKHRSFADIYAYAIILLILLAFPFGELIRYQLTLLGSDIAITPIDLLAVFSLPYFFIETDSKILIYIRRIVYLLIASWILSISIFPLSQLKLGFFYLIRLISLTSIAFLVSSVCKSNRSKELITTGLFLSILFFTILGILQYFFYYDLRDLYYAGWDNHYYRFVSTLLDPGYTAVVLLIGFVFLLEKKIFENNRQRLILSFVLILAIILTFSRAGYLTLLVLLIYKYKKHFKKVLLLFAIVATVVLLIPKPRSSGVELLRTYSITSRISDYKSTLKIFEKKPILGIGFNNLCSWKVMNGYENNSTSHSCSGSDSSLLLLLATTGIIGLSFFFFAIYKINKHIGSDVYGSILRSVFLVVIVSSFFNNTLFFNFIMVLISIFLGLNTKSTTDS